jgi:hypothetical protein
MKSKKKEKKQQKRILKALLARAKARPKPEDNLRIYTEEELADPRFEWPTIKSIVVNCEFAKEQLLNASAYIHNLREIDTDYFMVNTLAHLYENPTLITVEEKE